LPSPPAIRRSSDCSAAAKKSRHGNPHQMMLYLM
jgi:hypothetical protein